MQEFAVNVSPLDANILARIFVFCLPKGRRDFRKPSTKQAPLLLCRICSFWRTVALNTPELWDSLHIEEYRHTPALLYWLNGVQSLIHLRINASRSIPGQGKLSQRVAPKMPSGFYPGWFKSTLLSCTNKIRSLELTSRDFTEISRLLQPPPSSLGGRLDSLPPNFESLELLIIHVNRSHSRVAQESSLTVFRSVPRLRRLVAHFNWPGADNISLPWAQLTSLVVTVVDRRLIRLLLSRCPYLERASFRIITSPPDVGFAVQFNPVIMHHLKYLRLTFVKDLDLTVLKPIQLPVLKGFQMIQLFAPQGPIQMPKKLYREISIDTITTLSFGRNTPLLHVICLIRETKRVTRLKLELGDKGGLGIFTLLRVAPGDPTQNIFLPRLQKLWIWTSPAIVALPVFASADFVKMLASRSRQAASTFGISSLQNVEFAVRWQLKALKKDIESIISSHFHGYDLGRIAYTKVPRTRWEEMEFDYELGDFAT